METMFKKGDKVRAKKGLLQKLFPFLRSKPLTVTDVHELQYHGENFKSVGVSGRMEVEVSCIFPKTI